MHEFAEFLAVRALKRGAESAEIFFFSDLVRRIHYRDRDHDGLEISEDAGFALRLAQGGKRGFAFLSGPDHDAGLGMVEEALVSARLADEPAVPFTGDTIALPTVASIEDPLFLERDERFKREYIEGQIERAFAVSKRVKRVKRVSYTERFSIAGLVTTEGFRGEKRGTLFSLGAQVMAQEGEEKEAAYEWSETRLFDDLTSREPAVEAALKADGLLGGRPVPTGRYTVVLDPSVAVDLLLVLAQALSGEMVLKGKSPLAGKLGTGIASPIFSLIDDGLLPGGCGSEPFDDEGVTRRATVLVRLGNLESYLLNLKAAALLAMAPTGNGQRPDYKAPPVIRPGNLFIAPGTASADDLRSQVSSGIEILEIMGAHTLDPVSGNISLGAAGFVIAGGARSRPFRGVTVAGNLYELFHRLAAVGCDLRFYGATGSPSLLLESLDIAGEG